MRKYVEIEVEERSNLGRTPAKRMRRKGLIPGIVYGGKRPPVPITIDSSRIQEILKSESGINTIFLLRLKGKGAKRHVMIRDFQRDPVTESFVHTDFIRILMDEKVEISVPVKLEGIPEGVKNQGGILDFILRDIRVSCLPSHIPEHLVADVTSLLIGDSAKVSDLPWDENLEILTPADQPLAVVSPPVKEEEPAEPAAEEEAKEPEVIQKGKAAEGEPEKEEPKEGKS